MNTKKRKNAVKTATRHKTLKNAPTSVPSIQTLNDAFRAIERATDDFKAVADDDSVAWSVKKRRMKVAEAAFRAFDAIRDALPPVAFNSYKGEYYLVSVDEPRHLV